MIQIVLSMTFLFDDSSDMTHTVWVIPLIAESYLMSHQKWVMTNLVFKDWVNSIVLAVALWKTNSKKLSGQFLSQVAGQKN